MKDDVLDAVAAVGASGRYILGDHVAELEAALAARLGAGQAVGVGSGLDALEIALRCLDVEPGERVLTTPLSAFATTLALVRLGAIPVFADVDGAGLLDLDECRRFLRQSRGVRGLLPVHLYGHALDLDALAGLREEFGLWIVEDCAQAVGATWRGRPVGTVAEVAATSFYPTKNLGALGDGGAVLTGSPAHAERARRLRNYGQEETYCHVEVGLNSRLDELHAAVLHRALLPRLAGLTARRREIAARYCAEIRCRELRLPRPGPGSDSVWHLFPVLVKPGMRDAFVRHLRERGVETGAHYPTLISEQPALLRYGTFEVTSDLPRAHDFAANEVSLPVHPFLAEEELEHVIAACNDWRPR